MKPAKSVNLLKPPCGDQRRRSIGNTLDSGLDDARRRSSNSFSGLVYQNQCPTDSCSPLDVRQLYRLRASWKAVQRNLENVGMEFFAALFRQSPDSFEHYRVWNVIFNEASRSLNLSDDKKLDVLKFDDDFKTHSRKFMQYLDDIVQRFDDIDARNNAIRSLTCYHRRLCNGPAEFILKLEEPLMETLRRTLEDRFNKEVEAIYTEFLQYVLNETLQKLKSSSSRNSSIDSSRLLDSPSPTYLRNRRRSGTPNLNLPRIDD